MIRAMGVAVMAMVAIHGAVAQVQAQTIALTGGLVYPISSEPVEGGTVLMVDGRIAAVGLGVAIPAGAEVVDVTGSVVMPGIIDAMSYYGLAGEDMNEVPNPLTPELRIVEAFNPFGGLGAGAGRRDSGCASCSRGASRRCTSGRATRPCSVDRARW